MLCVGLDGFPNPRRGGVTPLLQPMNAVIKPCIVNRTKYIKICIEKLIAAVSVSCHAFVVRP